MSLDHSAPFVSRESQHANAQERAKELEASAGGDAAEEALADPSVGTCLVEHELQGGALRVRPDRYIMGSASTQEQLMALIEAVQY